jgi:ribonuclease E
MTKRMLIDATHPEETRVVVLDGNRLEEFDVETSTKRTLKGNIYLARVVRVEPSLQAAFVEFGGNRHGFLAFGEIHPDYYQIPVADRQRLLALAEQEAAEEEEDGEEPAPAEAASQAGAAAAEGSPQEEPPGGSSPAPESPVAASEASASAAKDTAPTPPPFEAPEPPRPAEAAVVPDLPPAPASTPEDGTESTPTPRPPSAQPVRIEGETISAEPDRIAIPPAPQADPLATAEQARDDGPGEDSPAAPDESEEARGRGEVAEVAAEPAVPETIGGGDGAEEERPRRINPRFLRNYKIQEVIKRRQILLVQVVKEERGNKGAALTTYLSLAGRYCVLMPNTPHGGGISRKISSAADRKRLREIMAELDLPKGMGLIVRTAGANRPKAEIKRDCEYLLRLWDSIREKTLASVAPALIYEEANLIKRAIRDLYSRDIDEILVDGEEAYRAAKDFMRMLIPSHAKKVQLYRDGGVPLFARAGVEAQLDAMHSPRVELRSGGSIVINQTEALVAIDVNSGRSTRERNIEETALKTNLEAADEIARQLRLRDLAGLIVIDFIDMETSRNNAAVERRLKEALKHDRARIQVGRISHFGLLEMSRQRLRPSLTETAFVTCPHCGGTGLVRSTESAAVQVLRAIEDEAARRRAGEIVVRCAGSVALYLLNMKRQRLAELEAAFSMRILFAADDTLIPPAHRIERTKPPVIVAPPAAPAPLPPPPPAEDDEEEAAAEAEVEESVEETAQEGEREAQPDRPQPSTGDGERRRRRRRRRRGRREEGSAAAPATVPPGIGDQPGLAVSEPAEAMSAEAEAEDEGAAAGPPRGASESEEAVRTRRRRGRRGGRRRRREDEAGAGRAEPAAPPVMFQGATPANPFGDTALDLFEAIERELTATDTPPAATLEVAAEPVVAASGDGPPAAAAPSPPAAALPEPPVVEPVHDAPQPAAPASAPERKAPIASMEIKPIVVDEAPPDVPRKRGWWRR